MKKIIHFKEDTSKPENRVNITLFHLLMIDDVRNYIVSKLGLNRSCVIYPAPNLETEEFDTLDRPDYKIEEDGRLTGYIEVELGKDIEQVEKYKRKSKDDVEVYSIFGKISDGGDLSLEEIYYHLLNIQKNVSRNVQKYWSVELLLRLIKYYVIDGNFNSNNKRTTISDRMRGSEIISQLYNYFGESKIKNGGKIERGKILLNALSEGGFSLRVFSPHAKDNTCSLMNRTGGGETIYFPSYIKLQKYIDDKDFVDRYTELLISLGCTDIKYRKEKQRASLSINAVENNMNEICSVVTQLLKEP